VSNRSNSPGWIKDGNASFEAGTDSDTPVSDLSRNMTAFAVNTTFRRGVAKQSPGFKRIPLTFAAGCMTPFQSGFFQTGLPYNGATQDSLISSHGGRQFQIPIDTPPGVLATTSANFTIPAVNATVAVTVSDTTNLYSQNETVTIYRYGFELVSVDSATQITVRNLRADNVGIVVPSASNVQFVGTWMVREITPNKSKSTETTAAFTIPAVGATVNVSVLDATGLVTQLPILDIGGYVLELTAVNSPTSITVKNMEAGEVGVVVAIASAVNFAVFDANAPNITLNWCRQAENYWLLQDNSSFPVIFDGSKTLRANQATKQVPIGNVMCYGFGRLLVALPGRTTYRVGDLVFGNSGTEEHDRRDAILYFTENDYLNEGGDLVAKVYGAPSNGGNITAMQPAAMTNTSLGQGPILAGTPNVVFSVNLPFDRTQWKNLAEALQTANPINGPVSQDGMITVNTDVWYRSIDGIRSYITAQRQFNGEWGNTPLSAEVNSILEKDTEEWLEWGSGVLFDNRAMWTVSPQMTGHGVYHRGLVVLDFNINSKLRKKSGPAWEGIWTGLRILKIVRTMVRNKERCFMWVLNDDSEIELWEMDKKANEDTTASGATPISREMHTPAYNGGDNDRFKKLMTARLIVTGLVGSATITVQYRSDESACWNDWYTNTFCSKKEDCTPTGCVPKVYMPQTRFPIRLPEPPDDFDSITGKKKRTGYNFQLRIAVTWTMRSK
jgi:hypothetical protein